MVQVIIGFVVIAVAFLAIYAEFFDGATPVHKFLTPEEMTEI